jgi:hypothetical protein
MAGSGVVGIEAGRCEDGGSTEDRAGAVRSQGSGGEGQEEAERRDDSEVDRRWWTERPARRSSGVRVREWRRTGLRALVGCSGAGGARNCGCGATEAANNSEQRVRRSCGGAERRRSRGSEMRPRERIKEVEQDSWMCGRAKNGTGEPEQLLATGGAMWRLRATAARRGEAGRSQQGSGERRRVS